MEKRRAEIIKHGKSNQLAYLASDHMDVYVATSMRLKHEYYAVNKTISRISNHEHLKDLNLRWFDPTQAYCEDRIDKGLAEGLMLKRAKCTDQANETVLMANSRPNPRTVNPYAAKKNV